MPGIHLSVGVPACVMGLQAVVVACHAASHLQLTTACPLSPIVPKLAVHGYHPLLGLLDGHYFILTFGLPPTAMDTHTWGDGTPGMEV